VTFQRSKRVQLMAGVSQASYRRGFLHSGAIKEPIIPPNELRHEHSMGLSANLRVEGRMLFIFLGSNSRGKLNENADSGRVRQIFSRTSSE
jgi:hypothetical protein